MSEEFRSQYKSPQWQKKRLEALEAAEFRCQYCCDDEQTLHVHHKRYIKGRKVWEYEVRELSVFCECCHALVHKAKDQLNNLISSIDHQALTDIAAIAIGYCSTATGPAATYMAEEIEDLKASNPISLFVGMVAGSMSDEIASASYNKKEAVNLGVNIRELVKWRESAQ